MRITLGRRAALTTAATAALVAAGLTAGLSSAGAQTGGCPGIQFRSSLARIASTGCDTGTNRPPSCSSVRPNVALLWPPNHKFRTVTLSGATDPDGDVVALTVSTVTQDEPVDRGFDAARSLAPGAVQLRSERLGTGDGRVYRVSFTGSDGHGGACSGGVTVGVPHDMGHGRTPVDSGSVFNSFGA